MSSRTAGDLPGAEVPPPTKAPPQPLDATALIAALAALPGWRLERDALCKSWRFPSFRAAIAAMAAAAPAIDALDHHPEWSNIYDRLLVRLTTHDAGDRVSALDVTLAGILDRIASAHAGSGLPHPAS